MKQLSTFALLIVFVASVCHGVPVKNRTRVGHVHICIDEYLTDDGKRDIQSHVIKVDIPKRPGQSEGVKIVKQGDPEFIGNDDDNIDDYEDGEFDPKDDTRIDPDNVGEGDDEDDPDYDKDPEALLFTPSSQLPPDVVVEPPQESEGTDNVMGLDFSSVVTDKDGNVIDDGNDEDDDYY